MIPMLARRNDLLGIQTPHQRARSLVGGMVIQDHVHQLCVRELRGSMVQEG